MITERQEQPRGCEKYVRRTSGDSKILGNDIRFWPRYVGKGYGQTSAVKKSRRAAFLSSFPKFRAKKMGAAAPHLVNLKSNTMKNTLQRYDYFRLKQNFLL